MKRLTEKLKLEIAKLCKEGMTTQDICEELHVGKSSVSRYRDYGRAMAFNPNAPDVYVVSRETCYGCRYYGRLSGVGMCCNYSLIKGISRPCPCNKCTVRSNGQTIQINLDGSMVYGHIEVTCHD